MQCALYSVVVLCVVAAAQCYSAGPQGLFIRVISSVCACDALLYKRKDFGTVCSARVVLYCIVLYWVVCVCVCVFVCVD